MVDDGVWLSYRYQGWLFEFTIQGVFITNPITKQRYRMTMEPYNTVPFIYTNVEDEE